MRILKNILIGCMLSGTLLIGGCVIVAYLYEDEIKQYALSQLNEQLESPINVSEINLSALKRFPSVSLEFTNIWAEENIIKIGKPDTLFFFENANLQFNLLDVLRNDYKLKQIGLESGFMHLKIDKDGYENYIIWKQNENKNNDFLLELENLKGNDITFSLLNQAKNDFIQLFADRINLSGEFSASEFLMDTDGNLWVEKLKLGNTDYITKRKVDITAGIDINKNTSKYSFKKSAVLIDREHDFVVAGFLQNLNDGLLAALKIQGKELDIVTALELLPEKQREQLANYKSEGVLNFHCLLSGTISKTQNPGIDASFSVQNGKLKHTPSGYQLTGINLAGNYKKNNEGTVESFELIKLSAQIAEGTINTSFSIKDFNHPAINATFTGNFESEKLAKFLNIDTLQNITGNIQTNVNYNGKMNNLSSFSAKEFLAGNLQGDVIFSNMNLQFKNGELAYKNLTGELAFSNNNIDVKKVSGKLKNCEFELTGELNNALPYLLLPKEKLGISTTFKTEELNLDSLLNSSNANANYELKFPENVDVRFTASIGKLTFRKFKAENISGVVSVKDQNLIANSLHFHTAGGTVKGNLEIEPAINNQWMLTSNVDATNLDINQVFIQFENFGQNIMQARHLKGKASTNVEFASLMQPDLSLVSDKILTNAKLTITNGELVGFEPMDEIADYFKSNIALRALIKPEPLREKLAHIKFSKMENEIRIKNEQIYIPKMDIRSTALDLELAGAHTFNNEIDYSLNFYFTDLMTRKKASNSQFDYVKDDGLGRTRVFITMKGTVDNPNFGYDMLALKKNVKEEVQQEKKTVKSILKEEFGLYKNDSTVKVAQQVNKEPDYRIEWKDSETEANPETSVETPQPASEKKKRGLGSLLKPEKEGKEKEVFEFEEDDF